MTNKYLEKAAFIAGAMGATAAKSGDKIGGFVSGEVGGGVGLGVGQALGSLTRNPGITGGAALAGYLAGGVAGGGAYSALKKKIQGKEYHKKEAGLSTRILGGAALGAGVGAASAGEGNRVAGAMGGAALGAGAGALAGKLMVKKPKLLTDGKVHKMNNPQLFGADGNAINPLMLKAK